MFNIKYAIEEDLVFWNSLDDLKTSQKKNLIKKSRAYIIWDGETPIGIMRYNFMWDEIPFLTLIYILDEYHRKGFGRLAMALWEAEMKVLGHKMVMTSTRADEEGQYFYLTLGYAEMGRLSFEGTHMEQDDEIILRKIL